MNSNNTAQEWAGEIDEARDLDRLSETDRLSEIERAFMAERQRRREARLHETRSERKARIRKQHLHQIMAATVAADMRDGYCLETTPCRLRTAVKKVYGYEGKDVLSFLSSPLTPHEKGRHLPHWVKVFMVRSNASGFRPREVIIEVKKRFDVEVTSAHVARYNPSTKAGQTLRPEFKKMYHDIRSGIEAQNRGEGDEEMPKWIELIRVWR